MEEFAESMEVETMPVEDDGKTEDTKESKPFPWNNSQTAEIRIAESRYENYGGTFLTGIDIFSKEEKLKMEERAKRFGLTDRLNKISNQEQDLYASMGIVEENENTRNVRLNVLHMRGTEDMSTKDVFKYFEDYAPASIEWINDVSCNVVWLDNVSAARAMLGLSRRITGLNEKPEQREVKSDGENDATNENCPAVDGDTVMKSGDKEESDDGCVHIKDIDYPLPPGLWRKGVDYPKSKGVFLRFATRADKKQPNAEKMSEYYRKHGNPNFGGIKGILTESRKRMYKQIKQTKRRPSEGSNESDRKRPKNPWGALSESWGLVDIVEDGFAVRSTEPREQPGRSVKERLGSKCPSREPADDLTGTSSDSEEEWCKRSKVLRMRMHADDEEEKICKRRARMKHQSVLATLDRGNDLRSRLGKPRRTDPVSRFPDAIQVVVTNAKAARASSTVKVDDSEEDQEEQDEEEEEEEDGEIIEAAVAEEREEGEWQDSEDQEEREEEKQHRRQPEEEEDAETEEDSDAPPAKEVQGPKGSVIKVVQNKPRVASTVWARLNNVKSEVVVDSSTKERQSRARDLRSTLKKGGDLRSRIGNHARGRSPLRIEVKNDKYTEEGSDTE